MRSLSGSAFRKAIHDVNTLGFGAIDISNDILPTLGENLYSQMNQRTFHPHRNRYYNEIAFYWPDDWADVPRGIGAFHDEKSLAYILSFEAAQKLLNTSFSESVAPSIIEFTTHVRRLVVENHFGLQDNELRLSRVMIRQMNESDTTAHGGSNFHEDIGYRDRAYQQLLSVIVTTHGIPTAAHRYNPKIGELLLFNAYDRRRLLGLSEDFAFVHTGPKTGPKLLFFFEFLVPNEREGSKVSAARSCGITASATKDG